MGVRKNYSISMNDENGNPLVWWDLIMLFHLFKVDLVLIHIAGQNQRHFKITLQAESIVVKFV